MKKPQVVMVTGASAGLGRAIAHAFAERGARIGLIARNQEALEACRQEVEQLGGEGLVLPLDVSDAAAVEQAAARLEEVFGPLDVWVNDAMASVFSPVREMKAEEYKRVTEVTYLGYVYGTLAALHRMLPRDRGTIIQVGSALSVRSIPLQSAYCAAKHAIVGFTDSLRCELYHDKSNVQISVVQMPAMNTVQFTWVKSRLPNKPQPVPPIFQPEVAAQVVVHAAEATHPRREYWVGSPTVEAIVGQMFIPGLLDRYLGKTGYKAQQTDVPVSPERLNNLWHYVPGTHSTHGPFDDRSHSSSAQVFADLHRGWFLGGGRLAGRGSSGELQDKQAKQKGKKTMSPLMETESASENAELDRVCPVHQRLAITCCCVAMTSLVPVALFQLHLLKKLPDPPGRIFNSRRIVRSKAAYRFIVPDGVLGIGSYGVTLALLLTAKPSRPLLQKALGSKLAFDAAIATRNTRKQVTQFGRVCSWCMGATIATAGVVYFAHRSRHVERLHHA